MNIRGASNDGASQPLRRLNELAERRNAGSKKRDGGDGGGGDSGELGELANLTEQLRETPEVREDVVRRVAERLATGQYSTREAAEGAARGLLEASSGSA